MSEAEKEQGTEKEKTLSPMWQFLDEEFDYRRPQRGDILEAEVVRVDRNEVIVNVGAKTEGVVPSRDLEKLDEKFRANIEVGTKMPVYVLRPESPEGEMIVSVNMARTIEDWREAERYLTEGKTYEGTVTDHNKGGLIVPFGQIRGFVPASQLVELGGKQSQESRMEKLAKMEGVRLQLKVVEVNSHRRRLILSERAALKEVRERKKEELLEELQEGEIRTGKVSNLCDFGAFIDLGGADGLIHVSELSWQRVNHPREVLEVGQEVEVYVLRVDREKKRIGLSLRRLRPNPWTLVGEKFHVGEIVEGTITNVVEFGAFVRIDEGIEGLIHISELSDEPLNHPREVVKEGDVVLLKILSIDEARQRIGLSLKRAPTREEMEGEEALAEMLESEPPPEEPQAVEETPHPEPLESEPPPEEPQAVEETPRPEPLEEAGEDPGETEPENLSGDGEENPKS